ncbi:hypothetical protein ARALYDRAFT_921016 [Arabidopsis lyrata subsp. lyrata]|nr:hypothetical protein ARALYDRAFT_921016 [Arabidopsis lyrata subsp. lyrata]
MSSLPYERAGPATTNSASYVPTARSNNNHDIVPRFRPEETTDTISLDIGIGIASSSPDHTSNEHQQRQVLVLNLYSKLKPMELLDSGLSMGLPWDPTMV